MSGTVYHAYDGIHCVADLDGDGSLLRAYTWGAGVDNLLAVTLIDGAATNTLCAVTDPLGTVHALVDASGGIAVAYAYDSWGNLLSATGDESLITTLRFTWQGREYSHATGLYNFRARWYDPAAGRWLSKDPIGLEGGLNLYETFGNNPVCFGDPEGSEMIINDDRITAALNIIKSSLTKACQSEKNIYKDTLEAINKLDSYNNELLIEITSGENRFIPANSPKNYRNKHIIFWNPEICESGLNTDNNTSHPPYIGLAHELGHAAEIMANTIVGNILGPFDTIPSPNPLETRAMRFENSVRSAAGVPLRKSYYSK
ncbi:MAG: hypothetical protein J6336_10445 [Kiritimatiellae bacterium]|nr:hypothetical protein [Kiritimatiellia bacterium]